MLVGIVKRKPRKVYYEFTSPRPIGRGIGYFESGIWWSAHELPPMAAQADRVWHEYHDNTIAQVRPKKAQVDNTMISYLAMRAAHCGWADKMSVTDDEGPC